MALIAVAGDLESFRGMLNSDPQAVIRGAIIFPYNPAIKERALIAGAIYGQMASNRPALPQRPRN